MSEHPPISGRHVVVIGLALASALAAGISHLALGGYDIAHPPPPQALTAVAPVLSYAELRPRSHRVGLGQQALAGLDGSAQQAVCAELLGALLLDPVAAAELELVDGAGAPITRCSVAEQP